MRVYEFAKKKGLSSKDILSLLEKGGLGVPSHMSVLSEQAQEFLDKSLKKPAKTSAKTVASKKSSKVVHKTDKVSTTPKPAAPRVTTPKAAAPKTAAPKVGTPKVAAPKSASPAKSSSAPSRPTQSSRPFRRPAGAGRRRSKKSYARKERTAPPVPVVVTQITVSKEMYLHEVADMMGKPSGELILVLLKKGMVCNRNQVLSVDTIVMVGQALEITVDVMRPEAEMQTGLAAAVPEHTVTRYPIVVVMGHVDHGKTTLLDYIRKHNVAAREKGGITQHLGAYEVDSTHGKIVFLDTPGHQAFSYMRKRGAKVTDIAILVVAADDGIKPQTLEAIQHARDAQVPIIVAINKIDKAEHKTVAVETVKRQLSENDLMPEDWGGQTICVPISAKTGEGVEELLEMIVLQSEISELKANPDAPAQAFILESKLEKGFGPVATVIPLEGTIKQGDYFVCGSSTGKVRLLINSAGKKIVQAGPSIPVQVVGFDKFVSLGEWLKVVSFKEYSKARSAKASVVSQMSAPSADFRATQEKEEQTSINLIIKTDTQGSAEAIIGSLRQLGKKHKTIPASFNIVQQGIGNISEGDVVFAADTGAMIVGLHVKFEKNSQLVAKDKGVSILTEQIIYKLIDDLEKILLTHRKAKISLKKVAQATVRKVFDVKGLGVIAGCYIQEGVVTRKCKVVCMRDGQKMGEGKITSLQREKKSVKEVHSGYECGFIADGFSEWQEDDTVEFYIEVKEQLS